METYKKPKDPNETDVFTFDWLPRLSTGETLSTVTATLVQAAGASIVAASIVTTTTRVTLAGGTAGQTAIWTVLVTTSANRTIEEAFRVAIVDSVLGITAETTIERLTRQISEAEAQRHSVALGEAVVEVWRDGRRVTRKVSTIAELEAHIRALRAELVTAQTEAGVTPTRRRRAIGLGWRN